MRKTRFIAVLLAATVLLFTMHSCNDDEDPNPEFIADDETFENFMTWVVEAENQGPDPALGEAHGGNDETVTRTVYVKNGQDRVEGEFPVGTLIVKHSKNPDNSVNEFTAMVKRGNDFNTSGGDWEWFMLNPDGTIATDPSSGNKMRGANLMNGMCLSCHSAAASDDYVFSK